MKTIRKKIRYYFDLWMSKGSGSMILLLLGATLILVLILGLLAWIVLKAMGYSMGSSLWITLLHTFDPGVIAGDQGSRVFLFLMLLATLVGMLFMALLIGFLNEAITHKMADIARGIEPVIEDGHTVILGFNESTFIVLSELILANENQKKRRNVVVIMDEFEKQDMEEKIRARFPDTGNVVVVCRSGSVFSLHDLERCSIMTAKSIVITLENDFDTTKAILAATQMLNANHSKAKGFITATIGEQINEHAARIAGFDTRSLEIKKKEKDRLELLMMEENVSRIVTHTCRQSGLSNVFSELFNFGNSEFYIIDESPIYTKMMSAMRNKTIREINRCLPKVTAVGVIDENGNALIGDPNEVVLSPKDKLIVFEKDDDAIEFTNPMEVSYTAAQEKFHNAPVKILIMECNSKLPMILEEMKYYLGQGSIIYIAADSDELVRLVKDEHITELVDAGIDVVVRESYAIYNSDKVYELLEEYVPDYVLMLSSMDEDENKADEKSLRLLLYVQQFKRTHPDAKIGLTCEMRNVKNQVLAQHTVTSDFIISRNIAALMMTQISENRDLRSVFDQLLSSEGFEVYIKPAKYYLKPDETMNYISVFDAVAEKKEILIGYMENGDFISNPPKNTKVSFDGESLFVVLAEELAVSE